MLFRSRQSRQRKRQQQRDRRTNAQRDSALPQRRIDQAASIVVNQHGQQTKRREPHWRDEFKRHAEKPKGREGAESSCGRIVGSCWGLVLNPWFLVSSQSSFRNKFDVAANASDVCRLETQSPISTTPRIGSHIISTDDRPRTTDDHPPQSVVTCRHRLVSRIVERRRWAWLRWP